MKLPDTDDPYVLLDVRPGATAEQIRRAYLRRVKVWKPDRHPAEFRRVREAYDRLREQEKWFDAWQKAGQVVRRAAEEAARVEAEAHDEEASGEPPGEAGDDEPSGEVARADDPAAAREAARAEIERALEHDTFSPDDEDPEAEDDVDALIAAR